MNIGDFLHSKRWKLMQNYIYSWGASVVLIGALFKLEHLPGASIFLGVGLSIEAIIFFVSAFEPMMELPDWKIIYPQMRTGEESARDKKKFEKADMLAKGIVPANGSAQGGSTNTAVAGLSDAQMASLKESFEKLSQTANGLKDITNAVSATEGFVKNMNEASVSVGSMAEASKKATKAVEEGAEVMSETYKQSAGSMQKSIADMNTSIGKSTSVFSDAASKTAQSFDQSAKELSESYKSMTGSLSNGYKGLEKSADKYVNGLEKLNKNLAAINTAYELHLKGAAKVETMVNEYSKGVGEIGNLLNTSIEETKKFNQNTKAINDNIQALNNIYGKMLGALNGKK